MGKRQDMTGIVCDKRMTIGLKVAEQFLVYGSKTRAMWKVNKDLLEKKQR